MTNTIRELRTSAGLTQVELARRSGVSQPNIAAYETGRRDPSDAMVERLRAATVLPHEALATHRDDLLHLADRLGFRNVRVFGSAARNEDQPGSDLDILVTLPQDTGLLGVAAFAEAATDLLGVEVDVVSDGGLAADHPILTTARAV